MAITEIRTDRREAAEISRRRADSIVVLTLDERAEFLREFAVHVDNEAGWSQQPFNKASKGVVPWLAAVSCANPMVLFDHLVGAVHELRAFDANEVDFALERDWPVGGDALIALRDRLEGNVDHWLQQILGGHA